MPRIMGSLLVLDIADRQVEADIPGDIVIKSLATSLESQEVPNTEGYFRELARSWFVRGPKLQEPER